MKNQEILRPLICDTMWVVRQADNPFVCFGAKPNKGLGLEISDETGSVGGGKRGPREARGTVGKGTPERGSWRRETQRVSRERIAEGTSQDELVVQSGQRSAEGGSEEDGQR